jgi:hypothetical protein
MLKLISVRYLTAIVSAAFFLCAIAYVLGADILIVGAFLIALAVIVGSQITARVILSTMDEKRDAVLELAEKVERLDAHGVRHQVIINSISDISNAELRKLLDVQKSLNSSV